MFRVLFLIYLIGITGCAEQYRGAKIVGNSSSQKNLVRQSYNFGDYYALLIYVDDYTYLPKLETPKNDVEAVAEILKNRYGFKEATIVPNPKNYDELVDIMDRQSKKLGSNDNLLIYYAGHGHYVKNGDTGFWQLKDARKDNRRGWISVKQAINFPLNQMSARHVLIVSDSCYSGAILRRDSGAKLDISRADMQYYSTIHQKKSRNALTSGALEAVLDSDPKNPNHSIFTNGFLNALKNNKKQIFTLSEKYSEINRYVQLGSGGQNPIYGDIKQVGHDMGGDFIFVDNSEDAIPIPIQPSSDPSTITIKGDEKLTRNAKNFLQEGNRYRKAGDIQKAMQLYKQSCDFKNGIGCAWLGLLYQKQGDNVKSIVYLTKACSYGHQKSCELIGN